MKRFIEQLLAAAFMLCLPSLLLAQTVDEIIENHIKAHGGLDNWKKVESLELKGSFTGFSLEKPFHAFKTRDGMYYADLSLGEEKVQEAFNGTEGWTIDPWEDISHARKLSKAEHNVFRQKAEFFSPFFRYKEKGHTVEFTGKEMIDGMELLALKLTRANGKIENWYLDPNTYLEYLCVSEWVDFAWPSQAEAYFDDFREVNGLVLPFFTDRTFGQRNRILQIEEVNINPDIDENVFIMPNKQELEKLKFLVGQWDVNVEVMTGRGTWYPLGTTSSSIEYVSPMLLEENIQYERIMPISRKTAISYHDASHKYRVSVFNDLTASIEIFEGSLTDSTFVYDNLAIKIGDMENTRFTKVEINKQENGGFILSYYVTGDEGKTWNVTDRFSYSKKVE